MLTDVPPKQESHNRRAENRQYDNLLNNSDIRVLREHFLYRVKSTFDIQLLTMLNEFADSPNLSQDERTNTERNQSKPYPYSLLCKCICSIHESYKARAVKRNIASPLKQ